MSRQYITTAIDYANAPPHMGHVMEKILADIVARWFRVRGDEVRFQVGMDEHGIKVQRTAEKEGVTPTALVDRLAPLYEALFRQLGISYDVFVRTTDREKHWPTVTALWKKLAESGALEKRAYTGLYCQGCERFLTKRDLEDGLCPIHNAKPEEVTEENWFFLLQREGEWLKDLLSREEEGYRIVPKNRAQETLTLIEQGLEDVSFSRPKSTLTWGIPVPEDEAQVMYVWCDALTNYISGIDIFGLSEGPFDSASLRSGSFDSRKMKHGPSPDGARTMSESASGGRVEWWDGAEVTHVIGKDIARFHALIWPAMLKGAGVSTPDRLLIHGFLTSEGQKMSKTIGNVVHPQDVLTKFLGNPDPLRFYLSHEIPVGNDGDFSWKRIEDFYNSILRNGLGNLLNRVMVMLKKEGGELHFGLQREICDQIPAHWEEYRRSMDAFDLSRAAQRVIHLIGFGNGFMDSSKPWKLEGEERVQALTLLAEVLRHITLMLLPFVPQTAQEMAKQLNLPEADRLLEKGFTLTPEMQKWEGAFHWKTVGEPRILFAPLA